MTEISLDYSPQPRQALLHGTAAHQIFYGGAVGGGKSHSLRWDAIGFCLDNPGMDAYLFRRTRAELQMTHIRRIELELPLEIGKQNKTDNRFEFKNNAMLNFCYCENENDVTRYQSAEFHWLGVDEASHLTEFQLSYLRGRVRLGGWNPRGWSGDPGAKFKGLLPRIVFGSNPGGPGHDFLKRTYILPAGVETIFADETMLDDEDDQPWPTIYIPAKIKDNKYLAKGYAGQFKSLGPEMFKALTEGDWDAVVGQALHNLSREKHLLRPFNPPRHWTKFMVIDWGSARPFSVGWYTVSEGAVLNGKRGAADVILPAGALIRYNEWYGWNGQTNKGCGMASQNVAREVIKREKEREEVMDYRVGDSEMWARHDGPSTADRMFDATDGRFLMRKSVKDRKQNYNEVISRLAGDPHFMEDGVEGESPMLFVTSNCEHWWRTVPVLVLDTNDPDKGPDTKMEDHCLSGDTRIWWTDGGNVHACRMDELSNDGMVWTSEGWSEFENLGQTAIAEVWRVRFDDGLIIEATPSHRFLCADDKYRRLDDLSYGDIIKTNKLTLGSSSWLNISKERRIGSVGDIINVREGGSTGSFGNTITALSSKVSMFTTLTETVKTMLSVIWNYSLAQYTYANMARNRPITPDGIWKPECAPRPSSGTNPRQDESGIKSRQVEEVRLSLSTNSPVEFVARKDSANSPDKFIVPPHATKSTTGVSIRNVSKGTKKPVYNIHVPGVNNFTLTNGVIMHNCYDELAYACRSRPYITTEKDRYLEEWGGEIEKARGKSVDPYATA